MCIYTNSTRKSWDCVVCPWGNTEGTPRKGHLPNQDTWPSPNLSIFCPLKWGHLPNQDTFHWPKGVCLREVPLYLQFSFSFHSVDPPKVLQQGSAYDSPRFLQRSSTYILCPTIAQHLRIVPQDHIIEASQLTLREHIGEGAWLSLLYCSSYKRCL